LTGAGELDQHTIAEVGLNEELPCFPTGFTRLDEAIGGGLYSQKFYGIAADHKVGKSMLMATVAYNLTLSGVPTLYLSLEMGPDEQVQRLMARLMGLNSLAFLDRRGRRSQGLQSAAAEAAVELRRNNHLVLMHRPRMALEDVRETIARAALRRHIKGVFVDYLPLIDGQRRNENLAAHYDNVAQVLAEATKRYGIWVVAAAQTNRDGGIRQCDGLLKACDMTLKLHKSEMIGAPDQAWLEMMASRFTPRIDIGSKQAPAFEIDTRAGPHFREIAS
jgi:replicative DNA helicase